MSIAVVGEALIDFIVSGDDSYRPQLGGSPYNVAIGLARQGINVGYLSPLSDDTFGDKLHASLIREGVNLPLRRRSSLPTSLALVAIDNAGQPNYRLYRQGVADKDVSFEELRDNLPSDLRLFHTGSLAITPSQLPKIRQLFEHLRAQGVQISVDINVRLRASADNDAYQAGIRSLFPLVDIIKASDEDLRALNLHDDPRSAAETAFKAMNGGIFLYTEGGAGAAVLSSDGRFERNAYKVSLVQDTVGAGDTFYSAFLAELYRSGAFATDRVAIVGSALAKALDFASAAAAINVSRVGCSPPTAAEVAAFLSQQR